VLFFGLFLTTNPPEGEIFRRDMTERNTTSMEYVP